MMKVSKAVLKYINKKKLLLLFWIGIHYNLEEVYFYQMIEEFHQVLHTPQNSAQHTISLTQNLILSSFEQIFPPDTDLSHLHQIYQEVLGQGTYPGDPTAQISLDHQVLLNHRLIQYFLELSQVHFVHVSVYQALEEQTQKAENTIRNHIKTQQEMKMYLQYLQAKIEKLHQDLEARPSVANLQRQIQILVSREDILLRERVALLKSNQHMKNQLQLLDYPPTTKMSIPFDDLGREVDEEEYKGACKQLESTRKEKESYLRERQPTWQQDLTQKKKSTYFT